MTAPRPALRPKRIWLQDTVDDNAGADPDGNADSRQRGDAAMEQMKEAG